MFEYAMEDDLGDSMWAGETLRPGQALTSAEGGVELLIDDSGSIVMKKVLHVIVHMHVYIYPNSKHADNRSIVTLGSQSAVLYKLGVVNFPQDDCIVNNI